MDTTAPTATTPASPGPLPRAYMTPACRTGGTRWPDMHARCDAPGYENRILGFVKVSCACDCHQAAAESRASV